MLNQSCAWIHAESIFIQLQCVVWWKNTVQVSVKTKAWRYWHKHLTDLFTKSCLTPECQKLTTTICPTVTVCLCPSLWRVCFTSHFWIIDLLFCYRHEGYTQRDCHTFLNKSHIALFSVCILVSSGSQKKIISSLLCRCVRPSWGSLGVLLVSVIA